MILNAPYKPKVKSLANLKTELQKLVNEYVCERDRDRPCNYCLKSHWQRAGEYQPQAAHFFAVSISEALRFNENNIHRAHGVCNYYNDQKVYRANIAVRIGAEALQVLDEQSRSLVQFTRAEVEEMIQGYKGLLKKK